MPPTIQSKPVPGPITTQSPGKLSQTDRSSRPVNPPSFRAATPTPSRVLSRFMMSSWRKVISFVSPAAPRLDATHQPLERELRENGASKKQMMQVKCLLGLKGGDILMRNPWLDLNEHPRDYPLTACGTYLGKRGGSMGIKLEGLLPYAKGDSVLSTGAKLACEVWIDEKGRTTSRTQSRPEKEARESAEGIVPLVLAEDSTSQPTSFSTAASDSKPARSLNANPNIISPTEHLPGERKGSVADRVSSRPGAPGPKTDHPVKVTDRQADRVSGSDPWVAQSSQALGILTRVEALLEQIERPIAFVEGPGHSFADHKALVQAIHEVETRRLILMRSLAEDDGSEKALQSLGQPTQALEDAVELLIPKLEARSQSPGE